MRTQLCPPLRELAQDFHLSEPQFPLLENVGATPSPAPPPGTAHTEMRQSLGPMEGNYKAGKGVAHHRILRATVTILAGVMQRLTPSSACICHQPQEDHRPNRPRIVQCLPVVWHNSLPKSAPHPHPTRLLKIDFWAPLPN